MAASADVKSLTGLIDWRIALSIFRTEGVDILSNIALEIQRAHNWLDEELNYWQREVRTNEEEVVQAKAELLQRQFPDFSGRIPDCTVQEEALRDAKAKLEYAQDQIVVVRKWMIRLPREIHESYESIARRFGNFLDVDVQQALTAIGQQIASLDAYFALQMEASSMPAPSPTPEKGTAS